MSVALVGPTGEPYVPNSSQAPFHASPAKYKLLLGAAGSGKSLAICIEDCLLAHEYPGSTGVIFRRYYPSLRDTTKRTFFDWIPRDLIANEVKSEGREEVEYHNGSHTLFRVLDDYRKLGSMEFDRIGVDEAIEIQEREFLSLIARLRGQRGPRRMYLATNPPDEDHFLYKWFVTQERPDKAVFHSSTYDNREHLPPDYIRELEQYPPAWREKYLYGRWGFLSDGTPVFDGFDPTLHVAKLEPIPELPVIRGWDFGYVHPACAFFQQLPSGHVRWLHEMMGSNEELRSFATRVLAETKIEFPAAKRIEDYCDVAGTYKNDRSPTSVQILRNEFHLEPYARKYGIAYTIERIRGLLRTKADGVPLLQIAERCRLTRRAFAGGYAMDSKKDEPCKDGFYDNIIDAGRYAITAITHGFGTDVTTQSFRGKPLPDWRPAAGI
jgi:PBSX family phage terminase large subunit